MGEINNYTTALVDAQFYKDIIKTRRKTKKIVLIALILIVIVFHNWVLYSLKFGIPIINSYDLRPINTQNEPIQINYSPEERKHKEFQFKSLINNNTLILSPQAHYEISGVVVAYNSQFVFISRYFDSMALYDLGLAWGKIGDKKILKEYFKAYSDKTELRGSRILYISYKKYYPDVNLNYVNNHFSHSHIVPANRNVMAGLLSIKKYDKVKLVGDLVDMYSLDRSSFQYHTSMSRDDSREGDRGNGACETVFVKEVQVNGRIYR